MVQNTLYQLANQILRVGGVLQVVDRGEIPHEHDLEADNIRSHQEQAEATSLEVVDHQFKEYTEPAAGTRVTMEQTLGTSGRRPNLKQRAMVSIISIKR